MSILHNFVADGNFSEFPYIQYLTRKFGTNNDTSIPEKIDYFTKNNNRFSLFFHSTKKKSFFQQHNISQDKFICNSISVWKTNGKIE